MARVERRGRAEVARRERQEGGLEAATVDVLGIAEKDLVQAAPGIHPAGQSVVGATDQGEIVLDRAEDRPDGLLPLCRAFSEPAVIGQVEEEIGVGEDRFAGQMRENVLEADQDRGADPQFGDAEGHGPIPRLETARDGGQALQERQPVGQRHEFAEDDPLAFVIPGDGFAAGAEEETPVEIIRFRFGGGGGAAGLRVVGAADEPHLVPREEVGDRFVNLAVVAQQFGHRRFGPEQQVGMEGAQGGLGEFQHLAKALVVVVGVPDDGLRYAGLDQGQLELPGGRGGGGDAVQPPSRQEGDGPQWQRQVAGPSQPVGGLAEPGFDRQQQTHRDPRHQKRHAIHPRDRANLDQRHHLKLGRAQQVPRKPRQQPGLDHLQAHPRRRAKHAPSQAAGPGRGQTAPTGRWSLGRGPRCAVRRAGEQAGADPGPDGRKQGDVGAQRHPAQDGIERHRDEQEPVDRSQPEDQPTEVADPERPARAGGGPKHQPRRQPRQAGGPEVRKRRRPEQPRHPGPGPAALFTRV